MSVDFDIDQISRVATIKISRPEKKNALNLNTINQLLECLKKAHEDQSIRVVVITGQGKVFSAGGDINEMVNRFGKAMITKNRLYD